MAEFRLPHHQAEPLAQKLLTALTPACERVAIAGSVRRRKALVKDIELVAVPKYTTAPGAQLGLFGGDVPTVSQLDEWLEQMVQQKPNFRRKDKNGAKFKNFEIHIPQQAEWLGVDLFITTPAQWGYILALRTGPGDFNQLWVTQRYKGGVLPNEFSFRDGWLWRGSERLPTPDERDFLELIGIGWIEPEQRTLAILERQPA